MSLGRVLILNYKDVLNPFAGGAEVFVHEIALRLVRDGSQVTWISSSFPGSRKHERGYGYEILRTGGMGSVALTSVFRLPEVGSPDYVIESINTLPFVFTKLSSGHCLRIIHHIVPPSVIALRAGRFGGPVAAALDSIQRHLTPSLYRNDLVATVSHSSAAELSSLGYRNVRILTPGVVALPEKAIVWEDKKDIVVVPGPVKAWKRPDHAIKAFRVLPESWQMYIFGAIDPPAYRDELTTLISQLGLSSRVFLLGRISDAQRNELLTLSKISVVASEKEGWCSGAMEAQAFGVPVVGYNIPGLRENVNNGETGVLVTPGNIALLTSGLRKLSRDASGLRKMSENGILRARSFSYDRTYSEMVDLLVGSP